MRNLLLFLASFLCVLPLNGQERIQMRQEAGVYTIPCTVNGLKLRFIFDTGAANVSISSTEALFMLKNEYLSTSDIVDFQESMLADGSIQENAVIILRELKIGDKLLNNVKAVVMNNISAPLLLGQSAITSLQPWHFEDNFLVLGEVSPQADTLQTYIESLDAKQSIVEARKYEERGKLDVALRFLKHACDLKSYNAYFHYLAFTSNHLSTVKERLPIDNLVDAAIDNYEPICKWIRQDPSVVTDYCDYGKDKARLINILEALINKGFYNLCWEAAYRTGNYFDGKWSEGLKFLRIGAEHDDVKCLLEYANVYNPQMEHGDYYFPYTQPDKKIALSWYKRAIEKGNSDAISKYTALVFEDSMSSNELKAEAFNLLRSTAHTGNEDAMELMINIYFYGKYGYPEDDEKCKYWALKAVEIAHPVGSLYHTAHEKLGYIYYWSEDYTNAFKYLNQHIYNKSDVRVQPSQAAYVMLAEMYKFGDGTAVDYTKALSLYEKALEIKDGSNNLHINLRLAYMYGNGEGTSENKRKAFTHYLNAANLGDAHAQSNVAWEYYSGKVVSKDIQKAKSWFEKSAEQGYDFSNYMLGNLWSSGLLGYVDLLEAIKYHKKATDKDYAPSYYELGLIYETGGEGVQKSFKLAGEYFKKAAELGHDEAKEKYKSYQ